METRINTIHQNELDRYRLQQQAEAGLAARLGLPELRAGQVVIRDERNWRINEKEIAYGWLIRVSRSFAGWCWLFSIQFKESRFRDVKNPPELLRGIFTANAAGEIEKFYLDSQTENLHDPIRDLPFVDLFDANPGVALDGIGYEYLVFAPNTVVRIAVNNPNSENWKAWEKEVWKMGREMAGKSGVRELAEIFE